MAITGPEYKRLYADVGSNGRVNDFGIWNNIRALYYKGKAQLRSPMAKNCLTVK